MNRLTGEDNESTVTNVEGLRLKDMSDDDKEKDEEDEDNTAEVGDETEAIVEGIDDSHERWVIASHESGSEIMEFGKLNERLVGWDKDCFCGDAGGLKDSGIEPPMRNAAGISGGSTRTSTGDNYNWPLVCLPDWYTGRQITREAEGVG